MQTIRVIRLPMLSLALLLLHAATGTAFAADKPNIVLLYIDDWAWNGSPIAMHSDMPNSRMPVVKMPNIERLAGEGMVFQNAYGSPQCSPARACVLTGQTSARNRYTVYMNPRGDTYYDTSKAHQGFKAVACVATETLDPETTFSLPEALAPMGYVSAHIGKWHLRGDPGDHGYVLHDGDTNNNPGNTLKANLKEGEEKPKRLSEENMKDPKLMFSITDKAIGFIEEQVAAGKPFFVQISHYAMHAGSECLPETREKYVDDPFVQAWYRKLEKTADTVNLGEDPAVWLGMADDLDGRIGAVLDKLDALGIAENTYVVLAADNGYRHKFLPGLTQPLHAHKWWVWEGGIRVPMIVRGPGIDGGSRFLPNVVNYDLLPTFVDWAGGEPDEIEDLDGVSLAAYLSGDKTPSEGFLERNLYFHYPHYRGTMPHTAVVSGNHKLLHFWGYPEIPMLFDLSKDIGEVSNIANSEQGRHQRLFGEMMDYLEEVEARIPKLNPDYDAEKYRASPEYWYRVNWGPFEGERALDDDERKPVLTLDPKATAVGDDLEIRFKHPEEGAQLEAGDDLRVEVEITNRDALQGLSLYLDGLLVNAQGMSSVPQVWTPFGDYQLEALEPGYYALEAVAHDTAGATRRQAIRIQVGDAGSAAASSPENRVIEVVLREGERLMAGEVRRFPRIESRLKLEADGRLHLRHDRLGRLFQSHGDGQEGPHYAALEEGRLTVHRGKAGRSEAVVWASGEPLEGEGTHGLGITASKDLVIFREGQDGEREIVWRNP